MNVTIIGAGLAGLTAAVHLQRAGFDTEILEASDAVGGRVRSDIVEGFTLDRGFQVLQTAYPEAQDMLDYEALGLESFLAGAVMLKSQSKHRLFIDPLRHPSYAWQMIFDSGISWGELFRTFQMQRELKSKSIDTIFNKPAKTSIASLRQRKFSDRYIRDFWLPFYGGVMFDDQLKTDHRQLEFTLKMFAEGSVALPRGGMQAIPDQLAARLPKNSIQLNAKVESIHEMTIQLEEGSLKADCILDTRPEESVTWRGTTTAYFSADDNPIENKCIGLNARSVGKISNIAVVSSVQPTYAPKGKHLVSVSLPYYEKRTDSEFLPDLKREIQALLEKNIHSWSHLRTYRISKGLPQLSDVNNTRPLLDFKIREHVFRAGDSVLNGSINAAMRSGRLAAQAIIEEYS